MEKYTNLNVLEPQLYEVIKNLIPSNDIRIQMIDYVEKEMMMKWSERNKKLAFKLGKMNELQEKLEEVTDKFVEWIIDNKEYKTLTTSLRNKIEQLEKKIEALQDFSKYTQAWRKIIDFLKTLETYEKYLLAIDFNKKSSKLFWMLFNTVSNLSVTGKKVSNYQLFQPFNILQKHNNSEWWRWRDSNPRLKVIAWNVYPYRFVGTFP